MKVRWNVYERLGANSCEQATWEEKPLMYFRGTSATKRPIEPCHYLGSLRTHCRPCSKR